MKVYIVGKDRAMYDGGDAVEIQGVFDSKEAAEAAIEEYQARRESMGWGRHPGWEVIEYELNPPVVCPWD